MSTDAAHSPQRSAWLATVLVALSYYVINFVLTKNTLAPIHQDDYLALGYGFEDMKWAISRPISTNLIYLMGAMGPAFSFALLSAMTVALAVLVLRFSERVFDRDFGWPSILLFSSVAFAHMASYEHGKLLGLATTLSSNVAGTFALCLLWDAWTRRSLGKAIAGVAMYGVAVFAKEDYLLPPLVLFAWFWLARLRAARPMRTAFTPFETGLTLAMGLMAIASFAYNFLLSSNPFVSGLAGEAAKAAPYAVNLSPGVLATSFWKLTFGYAPMASAVALAAFVAGVVCLPALRWSLALMAAMIFVLMLPYAVIPNNMPEFRVYGWLTWYGGVIVAVLGALVARFGGRLSPRMTPVAGGVLALALAGVVLYQANAYRQAVAGWYAMQNGINANILESLRANRRAIAREDVVGIVGVEALSPWSNTDAQFLHRKLYFDNKWVVFVPADTMFFQRDPMVDGKPQTVKQFVSVQDVARACEAGTDMLVLQFDAEGKGTATRSSEWCASRR